MKDNGKDILVLGDCLEKMKDIPDGSVDLVLCDLPYGVLNKKNPKAKWDSQIPLEPLWKEYKRVCKPDAAILLFGTGLFTADLMVSNREMYKYNIVWNKVNPTNFLNARKQPLRVHENITVFYKKQPVYHPQMTPYDKSLRHGRGQKVFRDNNHNSTGCYGEFAPVPTLMSDEKFPTSIVTFKRKHDTKHHYHETEKPVDLLRWLIRTYSDKGDLVLDNTMGSGSTCVAAVKEHRHFIGIEKERKYYDIAVKRIDEAFNELLNTANKKSSLNTKAVHPSVSEAESRWHKDGEVKSREEQMPEYPGLFKEQAENSSREEVQKSDRQEEHRRGLNI